MYIDSNQHQSSKNHLRMNIYVDQCHICLDEKYLSVKPIELCQNSECAGFICKPCWKDILQNDIETCPICREILSTDSKIYTKIQREIVRKNLLKEYLKHIFIYLIFYSIGMSESLMCILSLHSFSLSDSILYVDDLPFYYYLISMITNPLMGAITWYISILFIAFIISICIRCKNLTHDITDHYTENYTDNPI
jgi:hypothetical protein